MRFLILLYLFLNFYDVSSAQSYRSIKNTIEPGAAVVTISKNATVNQAIEVLSNIAKQTINKIIVLDTEIDDVVGIEITNLNWYKTLEIIAKLHNLQIIEKPNFIKLIQQTKYTEEQIPDILKGVSFQTREVNISAIFFELDVNKSRESGINWRVIFLGADNIINLQFGESNVGPTSQESQTGSKSLNIGAMGNFKTGKYNIDASTLFNLLESNKLGEIIASPQITVRDRVKGEIQVGSDFSTREKDFAGNTIERFYSTGTIIRVTPYVMEENGKEYILLDLDVERSTALPGQISTEVKKTKANTNVLLLNGEETVIGGLFINEERLEREGIPFLKDLPWWFLGIRYLAGRDVLVNSKKELIIVLKAKLNPSLNERLAKKEKSVIQKKLNEYDETLEKIKVQRR